MVGGDRVIAILLCMQNSPGSTPDISWQGWGKTPRELPVSVNDAKLDAPMG